MGGRSSCVPCPSLCWEVRHWEGVGRTASPSRPRLSLPWASVTGHRDGGRGGPTQPSGSYPGRAPRSRLPWNRAGDLTGPPTLDSPCPLSPDPWRQSPRQPESSGSWGEGGLTPTAPLFSSSCSLFLLSFPPLPAGPLLRCPSPWPSPHVLRGSVLPSHFLHRWLFLGLCFPVWSLPCVCLSDFPFSCASWLWLP